MRLWKEDPQPYLTARVNLVPLAPLTNVAAKSLPDLIRRMADRINAEPEPRAAKLWMAMYLLIGLRVPDEVAAHLLKGVQNMRESTTYQAILREGLNEGLIVGRNEGLIEGRVAASPRRSGYSSDREGFASGLPTRQPEPPSRRSAISIAWSG